MRYDEYLRRGYPIASGVIEGACRHLVKDRMERSGMRWTLEGARSMLHVRAAFRAITGKRFLGDRIKRETERTHPHRHLLDNYQPMTPGMLAVGSAVTPVLNSRSGFVAVVASYHGQ